MRQTYRGAAHNPLLTHKKPRLISVAISTDVKLCHAYYLRNEMTNTYKTLNPLGSNNARDLSDNASNFDEYMNSDLPSIKDRFDKRRETLAGNQVAFDDAQEGRSQEFTDAQSGRESEFNADQSERDTAFQTFLDGTGWSSIGAYGAGVVITSHTQTVDYQGQPYSLKPSIPASLDAPYVTTGVWATEGVNFRLVGDNSLRQDLADDTDPAKGLGMTGRMRWDGLWSSLADGKLTGQSILDSITYNLWESAHLVTVRPDPANPSTWIWTPAVQDAMDTAAALKKRLYVPPGDYNINASLVAPADLITNIYSDNLYYTGAAIGSVAAAPVRFICDIPSGPLFTSPGRVRVRLNIQGIAAVNVSTVNPDCRFIECEVFGSTITENFAHSFHGFAKGNVGFISSIRRNVSMNTRLTALEGSYVDSYVDENYLSMSVDTVDVETAIFRGSMGLTSFTKNFSEFSVRGIVSTSLTNQTIRGNTWDYIAKPLDISGVSGGSIGDNKFTHCSKVFAGRLNLSPSNPLRTADWVSMNFGSTIRGLSVFGNVGSRVDILGSFKSNNYFNIVTTGNVVEPVTDVASSNILWDVATASIDSLTLTENNDRIYAASPNMSGVSEGQRFGVGNLRYLKLGGQAKLTTCSASKVLATVTTSELLDMSALPLRVPLRLHVVVGSGFSTYSYKIYDIYRDSGLQVFTITANEANAPVASSTVTVSGNNISINAVGSAASKTMAYNFLIL